ncbi:DUF6056 family protein [Subdoligranulum variabile]|uniref:Tat pathway signal sequence domain protein n=1 Tax=Subdoligranulum variabile DSM 15176 TaxID=411471 RepID=D1PM88_9FIRM|nr:DUF6056 family protein [Subdoligranulum variabile]EFB75673.1 hypothetical protein SUBVAR_05447 [Subdoligranulum variabile DSM 15176]UWP68380.1 DUF6056 family protein [Subdoligranulum variabile]
MDFWHDAVAQKRWLRRFVLLVVILLLPAAVLAFYARPSADDYVYAARTHAVVQQYGASWPRLLAAAWETTVYFFQNWQGLYVSGFVLALQPAIFGNRWYGLTFLCVLVPLFLCLYGCAKLIVHRLEPAQKRLPLALAVLLLFAFVEGMPSPVEGLYWFNGAMNYLPYFSVAVLNTGLAITLLEPERLSFDRRVLFAAAGVVIGLVIGGGHQVVGELNLLVLLFLTALCLRCRNLWLCPALAASVAGLVFNVTAPGTRVRTEGFAQAGLLEAFVKSFVLAAMEWIRWLDVPLLCLLVLLALPMHRLAKSTCVPDRLFRHPWAGPAGAFVLMWAMIFLPSYTMGGIGAGRLLNVVWMTFILGLAVSEFLLFGWIERVRMISLAPAEYFLQKYHHVLPRVSVVLLACMACIGSHTVKEGQDNHFATSLEAAYELASGEAAAFADALDEREAILKDPSLKNAEITPLGEGECPWLLYYTDVSVGPDLWGLTPYYDKESVVIVPEKE